MEDQQNFMQMQEVQNSNPWDELSDQENMIDENELEPDYYIDRPVTIFIFLINK